MVLHNYDVYVCSPIGVHFASASMDHTARLWTTDLTYPLRVFAGHTSSVNVSVNLGRLLSKLTALYKKILCTNQHLSVSYQFSRYLMLIHPPPPSSDIYTCVYMIFVAIMGFAQGVIIHSIVIMVNKL